MKLLRDRGASTFVQDASSSVIHGRAGAAIAPGAASHVLSPQRSALALVGLVARRRHLSISRTRDG